MRQLVHNVASLYVVRAVGVLAAVGLFPYIASNVTATEFGIWLLIGSIGLIVATSDFGMGTSVVRYLSDALARGDGTEAGRVIVSTVVFFAALGVAAAAVLLLLFTLGFGLFNIPEAERRTTLAVVAIVAGLTLLVGLPLGIFRQVLVGLHRMDLANGTLLVQILIRVGLIVLALEAGWGILGVVAAEAAAGLSASLLGLVLARRLLARLSVSRATFRLETLRRMLPYSLQVFVMGLASLAILQGGFLVIGVLLPVAAVTLYTAAFRMFQVCRDITGALLQAVVPEASRAAAGGDARRLTNLLLRGTKFANAVIIGLAVPPILLAEPLLRLWVGDDFTAVAPVAQVLLAGLLVNNNHLVAIGLLTGTGRIARVLGYHLAWAISSVALSFALVPVVGLVGVALGIGLPLLVLEPLYVRAACREAGTSVRVFLHEAILVPYACALAPVGVAVGVVVLWSPSDFVDVAAVSVLFLASFATLFLWLGMVEEERKALGRILRRSRDEDEQAHSPTLEILGPDGVAGDVRGG
jgi:O-antigen/teichoic acid export membrane protein